MKTLIPLLPLCAALALNGCAGMDSKTESAGIGAAIGCAAGAVLATLTESDAGAGCAAGAVVGGVIGYIKARNAEVAEAQRAAEAVTVVKGATVRPVQTEQVKVVDVKANTTETVSAFKSVSVDIPLSQVDTKEGREAMSKLEAYARKTAADRGETVDMTIAAAPSANAKANASPVMLMETMENAGTGQVRHTRVADPRIPGNVQRVTIEVKNKSRVEV
ncbi:MAG: glycine zipper domain-containing protein [Azoarcus sp.]|nr:glycine zipper domain-containing protein [Azoarcus sp.]